jgi:hypothetical protein
MASIRAKVRARTAPSRVGWDLRAVVDDLNPVLSPDYSRGLVS